MDSERYVEESHLPTMNIFCTRPVNTPGDDLNNPPKDSNGKILAWTDVINFVRLLLDVKNREYAIAELYLVKDHFPDLPVLLWYSAGVMSALIYDLNYVYSSLLYTQTTPYFSEKICQILYLIADIAKHPETSSKLIETNIVRFIQPFMCNKSRTVDPMRIAALSIVIQFVTAINDRVAGLLVQNEIVISCSDAIHYGDEIVKRMCCYILKKLTYHQVSRTMILEHYQTFFTFNLALAKLTYTASYCYSPILLKQAILCYYKLTNEEKCIPSIKEFTKNELLGKGFEQMYKDDTFLISLLNSFIETVNSK